MYDNEEMNDHDLACAVRDSVSEVTLPARPPLETIVARGGVRRRRRMSAFAVAAVAGAVAVALAIGLPAWSRTGNTNTPPARLATPGKLGNGPATDGRSTTLAAGLTAVNGCSTLAGASGILEQVNGSDLVIKTSDGRSVPITTSSATNIGREGSGSVDDIRDGAPIVVGGTESNGTIAAATVGVGAVGTQKLLTPPPPKPSGGSKPSLAAGTVTGTDTRGFTMVESNGTDVAVTTGASTWVVTLSTVNVDQLQVGEFTVALGTPTQAGTLAASRIEEAPLTTSEQPGTKHLSTSDLALLKQVASVPNLGCSSTAVANLALILRF
ncbi:MAG: hypothetical protein ACLPVY_08360 [Acidimicrobiia bacterium]